MPEPKPVTKTYWLRIALKEHEAQRIRQFLPSAQSLAVATRDLALLAADFLDLADDVRAPSGRLPLPDAKVEAPPPPPPPVQRDLELEQCIEVRQRLPGLSLDGVEAAGRCRKRSASDIERGLKRPESDVAGYKAGVKALAAVMGFIWEELTPQKLAAMDAEVAQQIPPSSNPSRDYKSAQDRIIELITAKVRYTYRQIAASLNVDGYSRSPRFGMNGRSWSESSVGSTVAQLQEQKRLPKRETAR